MATHKVKYVGGHDAVDLIHEDGRSETVERNHEAEVSASDRDSLVKQGDSWTEVKRPNTTTKTGDAGEES